MIDYSEILLLFVTSFVIFTTSREIDACILKSDQFSHMGNMAVKEDV